MTENTITTVTGEAHVPFSATIDGKYIVRAVRRDPRNRQREWKQNTRVYGALDALTPELMELEPFRGTSIPMPSDDRSDLDNVRAAMWHAWKNATLKVAAEQLEDLLAKLHCVAATRFGGTGAEYRAPIDGSGKSNKPRFSQKAGCSCPCSPGFILATRHTFSIELHDPIDLYIRLIEPETEDTQA